MDSLGSIAVGPGWQRMEGQALVNTVNQALVTSWFHGLRSFTAGPTQRRGLWRLASASLVEEAGKEVAGAQSDGQGQWLGCPPSGDSYSTEQACGWMPHCVEMSPP